MVGLAASTDVVSRERGLDSAKLLASTLAAAGQTQLSPGHPASPLCSTSLFISPRCCTQHGCSAQTRRRLLGGRSTDGEVTAEQQRPWCFCSRAQQDPASDRELAPAASTAAAVPGRCWRPCQRLPFTHVSFPPPPPVNLLHLLTSSTSSGHTSRKETPQSSLPSLKPAKS